MSGEGEPEVKGQELTTKNQPSMLVLSEEVVDNYMRTSQMLTDKFKEWLIPEVDFTTKIFGRGRKPSLLDPGSSKLIGFFQCRPRHRLLERFYDKDEDGFEHIRYVVACELVQESTGRVVAEGVGSCTSDEKKYKYRWFFANELERMGVSQDERHKLPTRKTSGGSTQYQARNPEIPDLDNTIFKMAAKRAAVDGALQLPGVAAVFTQDVGDYKKPEAAKSKPARREVKAEQGQPNGVPSFKNGKGVVIQSITPAGIMTHLAQSIDEFKREDFDIKDMGGAFEIKVTRFIDYWGPVNGCIEALGGEWISFEEDKKKNHWWLPKKDEQEGVAPAVSPPHQEPAQDTPPEASPSSDVGVSSIEELEEILRQRIPGMDELVDVTQDGKGFSVEPRKTLDSEIVETISYIVEGLGGRYEERQTGVGYEWLIPFVAGQQQFG